MPVWGYVLKYMHIFRLIFKQFFLKIRFKIIKEIRISTLNT